MIETIFFTAVGAGLLWLTASPRIAEPLYHGSLFEPHRYPFGDWTMDWLNGRACQEVNLPTENGHSLHGWFMPTEGADTTIIVNHGNTGNIADIRTLSTLLLQQGANLFVYDYRGYGKSGGSPSVAAVCEDAVHTYDFIAKKLPETKIILYGESLGGGISTYVAQRRKVSALILQSAFFEMRQIAIETSPLFKLWPRNLFPRPYFHNGEGLARVACPVLILHGAKDPEIRLEHANALFSAAKEPKSLVILPHTLHSEIDQKDFELFDRSVREIRQFMNAPVSNGEEPVLSIAAPPTPSQIISGLDEKSVSQKLTKE